MAVYQSLSLTQGEQSVQSNHSQVRILWESTQSGGSYNLVEREAYYWISVNGEPESQHTITYSLPGNQVKILVDEVITVPHDDKGEARIQVRSWMDTHISAGVVELSQTLILDTIPRPSTVRATDALIGGFSRLAITKRSSQFTHSIAWKFGECSGYVGADGKMTEQEAIFGADSVDMEIPESFYSLLPDKKSDVCTLTVRTYDGESAMPDTHQATFIISADERRCGPVVIGSVRDVRQETVALTGDEQVLIRYASQAECTIEAYGRMGAGIAEKKIGEQPVYEDRLILADYGGEQLRLAAVDSRGFQSVLTLQPRVIPYVQLSCDAVAVREGQASEQASLKISGDCYCGSFGAEMNSLSVSYQIEGGNVVPVEPVWTEDHRYQAEITLSGMDYARIYGITVTVADRLSRKETRIVLKKGVPVFDWGENDFTFHVPIYLEAPLGVEQGGTGAAEPKKAWENLGMTISMESGRTYETWYRQRGKTVYTALVECGELPNDGSAFFYHMLPATEIVAVTGNLSDGRSLPWGGTHTPRADVYCDREKIFLDTNGDFSGVTATVQIYYIKN